MKDRAHQLRTLSLRESAPAGSHLIENGSCRVNIAARVGGQSAQLLGRHVGKGAGNGASVGSDAESQVGGLRTNVLGQAEVKNL